MTTDAAMSAHKSGLHRLHGEFVKPRPASAAAAATSRWLQTGLEAGAEVQRPPRPCPLSTVGANPQRKALFM
jgi:hypothetical protein